MPELPDDLAAKIASTTTARQAVDVFIQWYDALVVEDKRDFTAEIRKLPEPIRQFVALHQAWSIIGNDGWQEYFSIVEEDWFDELACNALHELEEPGCAQALERAREIYDRFGEDFPSDTEDELHEEFYEPLEDVEITIGRWLRS